jgi:hypothetical protein
MNKSPKKRLGDGKTPIGEKQTCFHPVPAQSPEHPAQFSCRIMSVWVNEWADERRNFRKGEMA